MTNIVLKSARGVNYSRLQQLLAAGNWKEADKETRKVMLQVVSRESKRGWLKTEDIDNFPCEDLQTIDQLWLHYSQGKFGFSVQKEIYESLGGTRGYNGGLFENFHQEVWKNSPEHKVRRKARLHEVNQVRLRPQRSQILQERHQRAVLAKESKDAR